MHWAKPCHLASSSQSIRAYRGRFSALCMTPSFVDDAFVDSASKYRATRASARRCAG
jgi:hypothetical protein